MAKTAGDRPARDGVAVASSRLALLLAVEVEKQEAGQEEDLH